MVYPPTALVRRLAMALGLAIGLALGAGTASAEGVFNPKVFTLDNGLKVVVIENDRAPIVTHMVWYRVGAGDEPWGKSGIAHFLEHLMFKGTETVKPGEFSAIVGRIGGRENAFTTYDYTGYFQNVASDRLETVMRLEADRMVNLRLTEEQVRAEREVVLEERRMRTDNSPSAILYEQARAALFQNSPYGRPVIGWEHEIRSLTLEDALDFYRRYYAPNNAVLLVAGDVTAEQVHALAEKYYGPIPKRDVSLRNRPKEPPQHAARRVELRDPRVSEPRWSRSYIAPSYNAGAKQYAYALQILAEIMGGGPTSRLYRSLVVERPIATTVGAGYDGTAYGLGTFYFHASPRVGTDIAAVESAVQAEIDALLKDGVEADEVQRAIKRMQASAIFARDDFSTGARVIGAALMTGREVADIESWPERIAAVTVEEVNAAARLVLDERQSVTSLLLPAPREEAAAEKGTNAPAAAPASPPTRTPAADGKPDEGKP
jgi:zinc protease